MGMAITLTSQKRLTTFMPMPASFREWQHLTESATAPRQVVQHLTHIEDLVWTDGAAGAQKTGQFLHSLVEILKGNSKRSLDLSVKIDGAPAVIAGRDPQDGKFFVATKGAFAKTPRIAKDRREISTLYGHAPGLAAVMTTVFDSLEDLNWTTVMQGDLLFTPQIRKIQNIDGQTYVTFKPNTIMYGVPSDSTLGQRIQTARLGIAFHTTYTGSSLQTLTARPGADTSTLAASGNVLFFPVTYRDISGQTTLTTDEMRAITGMLAGIESGAKKLSRNVFLHLLQTAPLVRDYLMQYQNSLVRAGQPITLTPAKFTQGFLLFLQSIAQKQVQGRKTAAGQAGVTNKFQQLATTVAGHADALQSIIAWQALVIRTKRVLMRKLNAMSDLTPFYETETGVSRGSHEGFVAVDRSGSFVKLVDRGEFSRLNLTQGRFQAS